MNKAYRYRIYPTDLQKQLFLKTFGCCRKIWNLMLGDKKDFWESDHLPLRVTPAMYKDMYPYLREVDSLALANVQIDLDEAYRAFFNGTARFPKFKTKKRGRLSYTTNNQNGTVSVSDNLIKLPKIGNVKAVIHRTAPDGYDLKSATVSMESDGSFFCSVLYEYEPEETPAASDPEKAIGLDYKSASLYVDSNGETADMPHYYRNAQKRLARLQRKLSRKRGASRGEQPSSNYAKQQRKIAKLHHHIADQRKDHLHKLSLSIAKTYDIVCVESLNMRAMANHSFGIGRATLDNGYGQFLKLLEYKLSDRGGTLVKIDKWYPSSQICSCCGARRPMKLSERIYVCPACGAVMDRDTNAAKNILAEGLRKFRAVS